MGILSLEDFIKNFNLKDDTMNGRYLQRIHNFPIYPADSKICSDKAFVSNDIDFQGGTLWTCFIVNDNESLYHDSFGGQPDKFLLNQLPKPLIIHNWRHQDVNSKLCVSSCFCFYYLNERLNYYNAVSKMFFWLIK